MFFKSDDKNELSVRGFLHAVAALVYVVAVAAFMSQLNRLFDGPEPEFLAPVAMLMLFTLSAAVMALLFFGKPVMLYLDGKKREAVRLLAWTVGSAALLTVCIFAIMIMATA